MTDLNRSSLLDGVWDYPLFEALYGRRSRRFGLGFEIAEGPFRYRSEQAPVPLSEFEEALLVAAGIGVTGIPLWDGSRPPGYRGGDGRTFGSTAHGRRIDTMHLMWFMQAHHLDLDYYAKYFRPGACSESHLTHMATWHPEHSNP